MTCSKSLVGAIISSVAAGILSESADARDCVSGDACSVTQVTFKSASSGVCKDIPGAEELFLKNAGDRTISVIFQTAKYLLPSNTFKGNKTPPQTATAGPNSTPVPDQPLGCTFERDSDGNYYRLDWDWASVYVNPGHGTRTCRGDPPAIPTCVQPSDFQGGTYFIVSANYTIRQRVSDRATYPREDRPPTGSRTTTITRYAGVPLCIDRATENGTFQQLECRTVDAQKFEFRAPLNGCFIFKHPSTGYYILTNVAKDYERRTDLLGWGVTDFLHGCAIDDARYRWEVTQRSPGRFQIRDQATGRCVQVDDTERSFPGTNQIPSVRTIVATTCNRANRAQEWKLERAGP